VLNKTFLIGHVGNDFKETGEGRGYFSIYTTERLLNAKGEKIETSEVHVIGISGKLFSVAKDIVKSGRLFYVEAKLKHVLNEDKNGKKTNSTFINATFIKMLSKSTKEITEKALRDASKEQKEKT